MFTHVPMRLRALRAQALGLGTPVDRNMPEAALRRFAQMDEGQAMAELGTGTSRNGLAQAEATARLKSHGPNVVSAKAPPPWWLLLLMVIPNPFNLLLAFIAVISVASPERSWETLGVLMAMIAISSGVRFWQEYRSLVSVVKLQNSITTNARVRRRPGQGAEKPGSGSEPESVELSVHEKEVVPGDILLLSPGDAVAADCMILEANYLRVSQSSLTGESMPVTKAPGAHAAETKNCETAFDLKNVAFMGTSVVSGSAIALVLRTGDDSVIASIMRQLSKKREPNAFQRGIRNVTYMLIGFMLVMVPIVLGISGHVTGDWAQAALFSVSVAVGLVPEMLPAIVNTNLARGAHLLSSKKAIVKRLDAIQNLGAMTVLCSDKTGTLTKDEVRMDAFVDCAGLSNSGVFQLAYINAAAQGPQGNAMDAAIVRHNETPGESITVPYHEYVAVLPFTFERRRSSCVVRGYTHQQMLICKGAFEEVLALCSRVRRGPKEEALDGATRQAMASQADKLAAGGYRVLLVATKKIPKLPAVVAAGDQDAMEDALQELEASMTLEGLLTFLDPVKDDAAESVERLRSAGVEVKVLTGDNLAVAVNICQAIGIAADSPNSDDVQAITGPDLAALDGDVDAFDAAVRTCRVFAKLTPSQKGQVVRRLRAHGHCVGMLGDGVNDCVALRAADVGISVDSSARAAKDVADVILTEKGLGIVADGVRTGRVTYGNSIKYIKMVASANFGNVFSILIASAWLPFTPMSPIQLLVQNLLYDVSQIAIPWDRVDDEDLALPRRWASRDLLRFILVLGPTSSVIDIATFCSGWFYYGVRSAEDPQAVALFQTHWFLQGLLTQTLIVHMLRTAKIPVVQSRAAPCLVFATCAIILIGFCIPYIPPFRDVLNMTRPADSFVGILAALLAAYCLEVQLVKMLYVRIFKAWL
ncbi:MG transport ATPase [Sodiomyces alkalinus F11]|uniref:Magnesium-transporting ATPase, P-type 1 n=1 Tax=Sodiomyces alkalinus (strain CBS 110278 / VKM F-3762 / F11) TaxID=1314773 RepID=A0A3N2Q219_SODAK|nr:MG transport ATPase [Sodiomyces alkalinus F11]ROT40811.1 MG transport ATPase [Sodiomyces alkalinus F11]